MTDRRRLWELGSETERQASLRAHAAYLVEPSVERVTQSVTDLRDAPWGARERQLIRGEAFRIYAVNDEGWAYGESERDRYSGWIESANVFGHPRQEITHRVSVARSYAKAAPGLKDTSDAVPLSFGSLLCVTEDNGKWSKAAWIEGARKSDLYVPSVHLSPLDGLKTDPVAVAEQFLRTPYLWGGNSAFGIDCSGLVQASCLACEIACPGDSDMQQADLGQALSDDAQLQRGDLLFWKGHVAWVADAETILHANAFHMAVTYEPMAEAIARIEAQGDGPVTARKRLELSS